MNVLIADEDEIEISDIWKFYRGFASCDAEERTYKYRFKYFITDVNIYVLFFGELSPHTVSSKGNQLYHDESKIKSDIRDYIINKHNDIPDMKDKEYVLMKDKGCAFYLIDK